LGHVRLVDLLRARLVVVRSRDCGALITQGAVRIGGQVAALDAPVQSVEDVTIEPAALAAVAYPAEDISLSIIHEDDDLVIVDKPAGMHVHPLGAHRGGTLLNALLWHAGTRPDQPWGRWRPAPLHRLDRAASGLIAFGKSARVHDAMRAQLAQHEVGRRYTAIVEGLIADDAFTISAPLGRDPALDYRRAVVDVEHGGQTAISHVRITERLVDGGRQRTIVEVTLETGRTHQIRAHLASIGHPIAGDALYAPGGSRETASTVIALHATALSLRHPTTNELVTWTSAPPPDFPTR
jgi:23S rRNA pseudouridine1911/1915/1917 synthase